MYARLNEGKRELYQWDTGQTMEVSDDVKRIDFQMKGTDDDMYGCFAKKGIVSIPNKILQKAGVISAYVMSIKGGSATRIEQEITVIARDIPPGYVVTKQGDIISYDELTELFQNIGVVTVSGATMEGNLDMDNLYRVVNLNDPENDKDAVHKSWMEEHCLQKAGGTMTGRINGLLPPIADDEPARKKELDDATTGNNLAIKDIRDETRHAVADINAAKKFLHNVVVTEDAFADDTTYEDYPFRATIPIEGITDVWIPEVVLPVQGEVEYAPVAKTYDGGVYIYADKKPTGGVIIHTILLWRGESDDRQD